MYELTKLLLGGPSPLLIVARGDEARKNLTKFHSDLGNGPLPAGLQIALYLASIIDDDDVIVIPLEHFGAQLQETGSERDEFPQYQKAARHAKERIMQAMRQDNEDEDDDLGNLVPQGNA